MGSRRIWEYNENYFESIDTYEKAYWLGFIMADGYIMNQNNNKDNKSSAVGLRIRLAESDKEQLEALNEAIGSNKPIKVVKNYGKYENQQDLAEFHLSSAKLVEDLNRHGISMGDKSCHELMPSFDDPNITKNFILGLFDGDGSVSIYQCWSKRDNKYRDSCEWSIVSSKNMCDAIKEFVEDNIDGIKLNVSSNGSGKDLYRVRTNSVRAVRKMYEYFYNDNTANYYMKRKYDKMKSV